MVNGRSTEHNEIRSRLIVFIFSFKGDPKQQLILAVFDFWYHSFEKWRGIRFI